MYRPFGVSLGGPKHTDDDAGDGEGGVEGQDYVPRDEDEDDPDDREADHETLEEVAHQRILHPHPAHPEASPESTIVVWQGSIRSAGEEKG